MMVAFDAAGDDVRDHRWPTGSTKRLFTEGESTFAHEFSGIALWNPSALELWILIAALDCVETLTVSCRKSPTNHAGVVMSPALVERSFATWDLLSGNDMDVSLTQRAGRLAPP